MRYTLADPGVHFWELIAEPMRLDWQKDGDEWLSHLFVAFKESIGASGWGAAGPQVTDQLPIPHLEYRVEGGDAPSSLVLLLGLNDLRAVLAGREEPTDSETERWITAVNGAFERLGRQSNDYRWKAIIGPAPGSINATSELGRHLTIGNLEIRPARVRLDEWTHSINSQPSLHAAGRSATWPAIVEGHTKAFSWNIASRLASRTIHRLCVLLSVALESCWILRSAPQPFDDSSELKVPSTIWWQTVDETAEFGPSKQVSPPDWIEDAWDLLSRHQPVDDACSIYHEGLVLENEHPSFALIAFISAIETLGGKLFPPSRCKQCNQVIGSGQRFREAVSLVEDDEMAAELGKAYEPRSGTAHRSKLHGQELTRGALAVPGLFSLGEDFAFRWRTVFSMSRTARKLLVATLTGGLRIMKED